MKTRLTSLAFRYYSLMFTHAGRLGALAENYGWKPGDLARFLGVRFRRTWKADNVIEQAIYKGDDPAWLEEAIKQGGKRPARHGDAPRGSLSAALNWAEKRVGSPHEEDVIGGRSRCRICGWIEDANPDDPVIREWHGDTFGDERLAPAFAPGLPTPAVRTGRAKRVRCSSCGALVPAATAHRYQGKYIGDECCWDERLRTTE